MLRDLVSIIVPCYRQGHLISQAIESVLAQTYKYVDLIVVNDGSDDNTEEIARSYGGAISYIYKENGGLSSARNAGINAAKGKYLHFLDSDDLLHENAIERLVQAAAGREDVLCVMGYRTFVSQVDRTSSDWVVPPAHATAFPDLIHANYGPPHIYLASATLVREVGAFDDSFRSCEDWDLWSRLAAHGVKVVPVDHVGAFYRNLPDSMSKNSLRMLQTRIKVLLRTHELFLKDLALLDQYGDHLIEAEVGTLRRCIAQRLRHPCVGQLRSAVSNLYARGKHTRCSRKMRWLRQLLGGRAEDLAIRFFWFFDREALEFYQKGYC